LEVFSKKGGKCNKISLSAKRKIEVLGEVFGRNCRACIILIGNPTLADLTGTKAGKKHNLQHSAAACIESLSA
jgi:hypothetical protein